MKHYLFKVNNDTGIIEFNRELIKMLPSFNAILSRSRKVTGDKDGRKKVANFAELKYVHYMADWTRDNPCVGLDDISRHKKAMEKSGLDRLYSDWKPDAVVEQAILDYTEWQIELDPQASVLIGLKRTLLASGDYYSKSAERVARLQQEATAVSASDDMSREEIKMELETIENLVGAMINNAIKQANAVKKAFDTIEGLESDLRGKIESEKLAAGKRKVGRREDPKKREW
jgi:hypothetical protein